jgi:hypothetical protein
MTNPPGGPSPALRDEGNHLLSPGPAQLATGLIPGPAGWLGVVTIRTTSATVTVMLDRKNVRGWGAMLGQLGDAMDGGGPGDVASRTLPDLEGLEDALREPGHETA